MTNHTEMALQRNFWWIRDAHNPILPPGPPGTFDSTCCMNPCVVRRDDEYHLYYAGGDDEKHKRICLATAPVADPTVWQRHGPVLDLGTPGSFDANWCVLPHVVQIAPDRWHLYYTGNSGVGEGLSAFPGIGLAVSHDGISWRKYDQNPILAPTGQEGDPDAIGMAGGSVLHVRLPDGQSEWRFYYTGCPTLGDDLFLNQQKSCCLAVSQDGIHWERRGAVMLRNPERDYENVAAAGPVVHQEDDGSFRMWYSAIGTRWGAYSIAYAESADGIHWQRGEEYGDNLQLGPIGTGWERQMVEYPSVIQEEGRMRLFYCGNGYGATGIGTAISSSLRATPHEDACRVHIVAPEAQASWDLHIPKLLRCDEGRFNHNEQSIAGWYGPDAKGMIWHEWPSSTAHRATTQHHAPEGEHRDAVITGLHYRILITPAGDGLEMRFTAKNESEQTFHNVTMLLCLTARSSIFEDNALTRTAIATADGLISLGTIERDSGKSEQGKSTMPHDSVLCTSVDGQFTIGMAWERGGEYYRNDDAASGCIRIAPTLGDLPPGATRTVQGEIMFVKGDADHAVHHLRRIAESSTPA